MNKIYKIVWNKVRNCYVVASEFAKGHTRGTSDTRSALRRRLKAVAGQVVAAGVLAMSLAALPMGSALAGKVDPPHVVPDEGYSNVQAQNNLKGLSSADNNILFASGGSMGLQLKLASNIAVNSIKTDKIIKSDGSELDLSKLIQGVRFDDKTGTFYYTDSSNKEQSYAKVHDYNIDSAQFDASTNTITLNNVDAYDNNAEHKKIEIKGIASAADVTNLDNFAVKYDKNADGTVNKNSVTLGGTNYNFEQRTGGTTITNVAYADIDNPANGSHAVNVDLLKEQIANSGWNVSVKDGDITEIKNKDTLEFEGTDGVTVKLDTGRNADGDLIGTPAVKVGLGEKITVNGVDGANGIDIGKQKNGTLDNEGNYITGLDNTRWDSSNIVENRAATEGQLKQVSENIKAEEMHVKPDTYEVDINEGTVTMEYEDGNGNPVGKKLYIKDVASKMALDYLDSFAVKYDPNADGDPNKTSITLDGTPYIDKVGGTTITNVAYSNGNGSDAVNVDYLNDHAVDRDLTNITEGGKTEIVNIAKAADVHVKEGQYKVDEKGNVTMTYVDGNDKDIDGKKLIINDVASKTALDNLNTTVIGIDGRVTSNTSEITNIKNVAVTGGTIRNDGKIELSTINGTNVEMKGTLQDYSVTGGTYDKDKKELTLTKTDAYGKTTENVTIDLSGIQSGDKSWTAQANGTDVVPKGDKVNFKGDTNIDVKSDAEGEITVNLNKELKDLTSVTSTTVNATNAYVEKVDEYNGNSVTNVDYVNKQIANSGWNVSAEHDKNGSSKIKNGGEVNFVTDGNGLVISQEALPDADGNYTGAEITIGFGEKITVNGVDGANGIDIGKQKNGTLDNEGNYITGLDNTRWDSSNIVENRAATEGQLQEVSNVANKGWNVTTNGTNNTKVEPGAIVDFSGADDNIKVSNEGTNVKVALNKELKDLTSVTTNNAYVTNVDASKNESVTNVEYVKNQIAGVTLSAGKGISITDKKINVELTEGEENLVVDENGLTMKKQLTGMESITGTGGIINLAGDNVTVNNAIFNKDGRIQNVAKGTELTDAVNLGQLQEVSKEAGKHTTLVNGKNTTVEETTNAYGGKEYKVNVDLNGYAKTDNVAVVYVDNDKNKSLHTTNSGTVGNNSIALGKGTSAVDNSVAIGDGASVVAGSNGIGGVAFGNSAHAGYKGTSLGSGAISGREGTTLVGYNTQSGSLYTTVVGTDSVINSDGTTYKVNVMGIKKELNVQGAAATVVGSKNTVDNNNGKVYSGVANNVMGSANTIEASNGVTIQGSGNKVTDAYKDMNIGIGEAYNIGKGDYSALAKKDSGAVAVIGGANTISKQTSTSVIGYGNTIKGNNTTSDVLVAGNKNTVTNVSASIVMGNNQTLENHENVISLGNGNSVTADNAVAIGNGAGVSVEGGVALGVSSVASTAAGVSGFGADGKTDAIWQATKGAVSVGGNGETRQITNVAAGSADTDAVNVAQLKKVNDVANKGWNVSTNGGTATNVKPGDTVDFAGEDNIVVSNTGKNVVVKLGKDLTGLNSVTTNNAYVTNVDASKNESVTNVEYVQQQIANSGWNLKAGEGAASAIKNGHTVEFVGANGLKVDKNETTDTTTVTVDFDKNITVGGTVIGVQNGGGANPGKGNYITGLTNTKWDASKIESGRAATEDQLKEVQNNINTDISNKTFGLADDNGTKLTKKLDNTIQVKGEDGITSTVKDGALVIGLSNNLSVGKDGKDGHIGVNGADGMSGVAIDGKDGISIKGKDGKDAVSIYGKDGVDGINGAEGHIGLNGKDGKTDIWTAPGKPGLDGTTMTRVIYENNGVKHEVATLDDGLKFQGDSGDTIGKKLNETLTIKGNAATGAEFVDGNIGVVGEGGNLVVKLNKELTGLTSVTTNNAYVTNVDARRDDSVTNVAYVKNQIADAALTAGDGIKIDNKVVSVKLKDGEENLVVNQDGLSLNTTLKGMEAINGVGGGSISFSGGNVTINNNVTFGNNGQIHNVTAGTDNNDAVNVGQMNAAVQAGNTDTHIRPGEYGVGADNKVNMDVVDKNGTKINTVTITDVAKASDVGNVTNINNDLKNPNGATTVVDAVNNLNQKLDNKVGDLNYVEGGAGTKGNYVTNGENTTVSIGKLDQALKDVAATAAKHTTVTQGANITVTPETNPDGSKNYNVALNKDITVESATADKANIGGVSIENNTVNNLSNKKWDATNTDQYKDSGKAATEAQLQQAMSGTVQYDRKEDGSVNKTQITLNKEGDTYTTITNVANGKVEKDSKDAINGGQLFDTETKINNRIDGVENQVISNSNRIGQLSSRVNKVGAGAAALAALHPMDFDPDDKLTFSAGYGNYAGQNAAAIGAYYRPDEKVMFSVGGTVGNGENMVNAGISFSLDRTNHVSNSRTALAREVIDLRGQLAEMGAKMARMEKAFGMLDESKTKLFPDIPANHWAYEYIAKLAGNGIIEGYPDGNFGGDRLMTRYEFASMLYRAIENGAALEERIIKEFEPELGRIRVDRISGEDGDRNKIERVRVNATKGERDHYGNKLK